MSVQEEVNEAQQEAILSRPLYMGADRAEALMEDEIEVAPEDLDVEDTPDEDLNAEEVTFKKRYGDLRRHSTQQLKDLREELAAAKAQAEATPSWTPPKTDEELEAFKLEHPETFEILESVAHQRATASMSKVEELQLELEKERRGRQEESAMNVLRNKHPDWDDIREDENFHDWVGAQSKTIQDGVYENTGDGDLAARILDLYKLDNNLTADKAKSAKSKDANLKKEASKLVRKKGSSDVGQSERIFTYSEIESMSIQQYEALEAEIDRANAEGRVIEG